MFIEVKAIGKASNQGEEQLFRYAFVEGVPILILTDGRQWSFYLPAEEGRFDERKFLELDLLTNSLNDLEDHFCRFLQREEIISGKTQERAREFLKRKQRKKETEEALAKGWQELLKKPDDLLVDLLSEKVQEIC